MLAPMGTRSAMTVRAYSRSVPTYLRFAVEPLPLADAEETDVPAGNGEVVLLVDDETTLVRLGEEMLALRGHEPVGFDSPARALAAFSADPERFDIVVTDEVMPEITGT